MLKYRGHQYRLAIHPLGNQQFKQRAEEEYREQVKHAGQIPSVKDVLATIDYGSYEWWYIRPFFLDNNVSVEYEVSGDELTSLIVEAYDHVLANLKGMQGRPCFRTIHLPSGADPALIDGIGIYWTDSDEPNPYWADTTLPMQVQYKADVHIRYLDWWGTVINRMHPSSYHERELRFVKGVPLYVHHASVHDRGDTYVVSIDGYRRT